MAPGMPVLDSTRKFLTNLGVMCEMPSTSCSTRIAPLHPVATNAIDGLGRKAHMRAHGNAAFGQQTCGFRNPGSTLEFHDLGTGAHQPRCVFECLGFRGIGHEG